MKSKKTKRALVSSALALVLCFVMLLGTTFAWFTDNASTSVNKVQAGTLDVALEMSEDDGTTWQSAEGKELKFLQATGTDGVSNYVASEDLLWEPGAEYKLPDIRIANKGNLALKYQVAITAVNGDTKLAEVLDVKLQDGSGSAQDCGTLKSQLDKINGIVGEYSLAANTNSNTLHISLKMQESAGNTYQGLSIDGIAITVMAKQDTVEYDSNNNTYDEKATYYSYPNSNVTAESFTNGNIAAYVDSDNTVQYASNLNAAITAGATTIYLKEGASVRVDPNDANRSAALTKDLTIYANGADFNKGEISLGASYDTATAQSDVVNVTIYDAKNLTVWGNPKANGVTWNVTMVGCENDGHGLVMYRGDENGTDKINLVVRNCKVEGYEESVIHVTSGGSVLVENCVFMNSYAAINIAHKQNDALTVTVKDCTFIKCGKDSTDTENYSAPLRFVNNRTEVACSLTVGLANNSFDGTVGLNGDVLIGDYRAGRTNGSVTLTIDGTQEIALRIGSTQIQKVKNYTKNTISSYTA